MQDVLNLDIKVDGVGFTDLRLNKCDRVAWQRFTTGKDVLFNDKPETVSIDPMISSTIYRGQSQPPRRAQFRKTSGERKRVS